MTVLDIIELAMTSIGALIIGDSASPAEQALSLKVYNNMLGNWSSNGWLVPTETQESLTLTANKATYTIGPTITSDFVTIRPMSLSPSLITSGSLDYPVTPVAGETYNAHAMKSTVGIPREIAYDQAMPDGTLSLYPTPDSAYVLKLSSTKPMTAAATVATVYALSPEYAEALVYNLAVRLFPVFPSTAEFNVVAALAKDSLNAVKSMRQQPVPKATFDGALSKRTYDYRVGY